MADKSYLHPLAWIIPLWIYTLVNPEAIGLFHVSPHSILLELIWLVIVLRTIIWIDAYEPEPYLAMIWVVLLAASIGVAITLAGYRFNGNSDTSVGLAAIIEEVSKALILVPIFKMKLIHSWVDGYIYGALAGLGFSFSEDLLYASGESDPISMIFARGLDSIFAHSLFTGLVGAAIAFALIEKRTIGYLYATSGVLAHIFWNLQVIMLMARYSGVVAIATPWLFIYIAIKLRAYEISKITISCHEALANGEITEHELNLISNLPYRKFYRKQCKSRRERYEFNNQINTFVQTSLTGAEKSS